MTAPKPPKGSQRKLVNYENDGPRNFYRRASTAPPVDAEGKPKKVVERRKANLRENVELAREEWQGRVPTRLLPEMLARIERGLDARSAQNVKRRRAL